MKRLTTGILAITTGILLVSSAQAADKAPDMGKGQPQAAAKPTDGKASSPQLNTLTNNPTNTTDAAHGSGGGGGAGKTFGGGGGAGKTFGDGGGAGKPQVKQ